MAGRTPREAYRNFRDPMNRALGCITAKRLSVNPVVQFEADREYAILLNDAKPTRLQGPSLLWLSAGHRFRIVRDPDFHTDLSRGEFKVQTIEYWYQYETQDAAHAMKEVINFHWTPEATRTNERRYPHLHVGSVMLAAQTPLLPGRFHKVHIPTSRLSLEAIIRFGIQELGATVLKGRESDWESILEETEQAFLRYKTR